jgi:hypothetical protein
VAEILESEEFSFKGIGSEGSGDRESSGLIQVKVLEPADAKLADGCFLFIVPELAIEDSSFSAFLKVESKLVSKVAILESALPAGEEIISYATRLISELERLGLRRISILAREDGANIAQALCLLDPKLFRRAVLIDPRSRVHPTFKEQLIDKIESYLPVGLPFRASTIGFNSRPFLHRIRCPILVLISKSASLFSQSESEYIGRKIPNCYIQRLGSFNVFSKRNVFSEEILKLLSEFQETSAKRPQKNR